MMLFNSTNDRCLDVQIGDLDGNGHQDIVVVDDGATMSVLLNGINGTSVGKFTPVPNGYPICAEGTHLALQDYDNDSKLDVVVTCDANSQASAGVTRLTNAGNDSNNLPKWTTKNYAVGMAPTSFWPQRAFVADIDADGQPDMVVADYSAPAGVSDTNKS